ncbi:MAG: hypothetical protein IPM54_16810 [Polyangiaceae bacterium]|nr:hypothetical protein [Polyangiaceae bacterium]
MCRVLAYLGERIPLEDLLYKPDVSFVNQTHQAALLNRLNLAGSGFLAWDAQSERPELPFVYRSTKLPIYDRNLRALAAKVSATCLLGHLRGVPYHLSSIISEQNLHPFLFDDTRLALAHRADPCTPQTLGVALATCVCSGCQCLPRVCWAHEMATGCADGGRDTGRFGACGAIGARASEA